MTPPRRDPLDDARRRLDEAAGTLGDIRRLIGAPESEPVQSSAVSESVRREALDAARDNLKLMAADLEASRAKSQTLLEDVGRLRAELALRPTKEDFEKARVAGGSEAARRADELSRQVSALQERSTLLGAERVRLETMCRKAESNAENSEIARRSLEEILRRDLRAAHAALDRAASESGTRDAKAVSDIEDMRKRLDNALTRLNSEDRENRVLKQSSAENASYKTDYESAQAVITSLRRELAKQREEALGRENALEQHGHELERRLSESLSPQGSALFAEIGQLRKELAARPTVQDLHEARTTEQAMRRELGLLKQMMIDSSALKKDVEASQGLIASLRAELALRPLTEELKTAQDAQDRIRSC